MVIQFRCRWFSWFIFVQFRCNFCHCYHIVFYFLFIIIIIFFRETHILLAKMHQPQLHLNKMNMYMCASDYIGSLAKVYDDMVALQFMQTCASARLLLYNYAATNCKWGSLANQQSNCWNKANLFYIFLHCISGREEIEVSVRKTWNNSHMKFFIIIYFLAWQRSNGSDEPVSSSILPMIENESMVKNEKNGIKRNNGILCIFQVLLLSYAQMYNNNNNNEQLLSTYIIYTMNTCDYGQFISAEDIYIYINIYMVYICISMQFFLYL